MRSANYGWSFAKTALSGHPSVISLLPKNMQNAWWQMIHAVRGIFVRYNGDIAYGYLPTGIPLAREIFAVRPCSLSNG